MNQSSPWLQRILLAIPAIVWIAVWVYAVESDSNLGFVDSVVLIGLGMVVGVFYFSRLKRWASRRSSEKEPIEPISPPSPMIEKLGDLFPGVAYPIASFILVCVEGVFVFLLSFGGNPSPQGSSRFSLLGWTSTELAITIPIVLLVLSMVFYGTSFAVTKATGMKLRAMNLLVFVFSILFLFYLFFLA